jgi:hypothetical protein
VASHWSALSVIAASALFAAGVLAGCRMGPALPTGERTCLGFPPDVCRREVEGLDLEGTTHGGVAAYRIVCTAASCTEAAGEGTVAVLFADGTGREGGFGYAAPVGTPPEGTMGPLPVAPACLGVPAGQCDEFARSGAEKVADWSTIRAITVRCTTTCTDRDGAGKTLVTLADGTTTTEDWGYMTGE